MTRQQFLTEMADLAIRCGYRLDAVNVDNEAVETTTPGAECATFSLGERRLNVRFVRAAVA